MARFSDPDVRSRLDSWGVETIRADLFSRRDVEALPRAPNVIFMAGHKFGTSGNPSRTWAANAYLPTVVAESFPEARIVVFSSGNVYPLGPAPGTGPSERDLTGPVGEYAQSVLARERLFEYFSDLHRTPIAILRLNYAVEPRYGVLRDIAEKIRNRSPIDLAMGYVNVIWQRDANSIALRLLEHCAVPPLTLNVTGAEALSVRRHRRALWPCLGRGASLPRGPKSPPPCSVTLVGALRCSARPPTGLDEMMDRVLRWMLAGGVGLGKPTHFERARRLVLSVLRTAIPTDRVEPRKAALVSAGPRCARAPIGGAGGCETMACRQRWASRCATCIDPSTCSANWRMYCLTVAMPSELRLRAESSSSATAPL